MNPYLVTLLSLMILGAISSGLDMTLKKVGCSLPFSFSVQVEHLLDETTSLYTAERYDEALSLAHQALDISDRPIFADIEQLSQSLSQIGWLYIQKREFAIAEQYMKRALGIFENVIPAFRDERAMGNSLYNLGHVYLGSARYSEAENAFERAISFFEHTDIQSQPHMGMAISSLAQTRYELGRYDAVEPDIQRALRIHNAHYPDSVLEIGGMYNLLGKTYIAQFRYADAERTLEGGIGLFEHPLPKHMPTLGTLFRTLGELSQIREQHSIAISRFKQALLYMEKSTSPDVDAIAGTLLTLSDVYVDLDRYSEAEDTLQRVLRLKGKITSRSYAFALLGLGKIYYHQGDASKSEEQWNLAIQEQERASNSDQIGSTVILRWLGVTYNSIGEFPRAERLLRQALKIRERYPNQPDMIAESISDLAALLHNQGHREEPEALYKRALAIVEAHPYNRKLKADEYLYRLAQFYLLEGRNAEARQLFEQVLSIRERGYSNDPGIASTLKFLAVLLDRDGQFPDAEQYYSRAQSILTTSGKSNSSANREILHDLGYHNELQGKYKEAAEFYRQALLRYEKYYGPDSLELVITIKSLAHVLWLLNDRKASIHFYQRAIEIISRYKNTYLSYGSESNKLTYSNYFLWSFDIITSIAIVEGRNNLTATRLSLAAAYQQKGRVLEIITNTRKALKEHLRPEDLALLNKLSRIQRDISALYVANQRSHINEKEYPKSLRRLQDLANDVESELSDRSRTFISNAHPLEIEKIKRVIPADSALLEFFIYTPIDLESKEFRSLPSRYAVAILRNNSDPILVNLEEVASIDRVVWDLQAALSDENSKTVKTLAIDLYKRIFQPIRRVLGKPSSLLVSPDGPLNLIPFSVLIDEDDRYLVEQFSISYLGSGRDLLTIDADFPSRQPATIIGITQFGDSSNREPCESSQPPTEIRPVSLGGKEEFLPLPCAALEAERISKQFPGSTLLTDNIATETRIKKLEGPRILHLATHGYFENSVRENEVLAAPLSLSQMGAAEAMPANPALLRSGIALAYANSAALDGEDGRLTALEASALDLWGTQLVTLSACKTGEGEPRSGEGVFGLRRALVIAGSRSQLLSLWNVDDHATMEFMTNYYSRLVRYEGRSKALQQVQIEILNSRGPFRGTSWQHPHYWASFVHSGNWAPLPRERIVPREPGT